MVQLIVFLPLIAALIAGLGGRWIGKVPAKVVTTGALFVSCALSWPIFIAFLTGDQASAVYPVLDWIHSGDLRVNWELRVDALTAVMLVVVTTVSSLVHLYSWGYMAEDPSQPRFFAYLSLFTFAMLMLVTADSLVQMFFGWEGVGLASYLLIGFWYHKPSANAAAKQSFVVNRVCRFGLPPCISGPFLDRIDMFVDVAAVTATDLTLPAPAEGTAEAVARVGAAREEQGKRYGEALVNRRAVNSDAPGAEIEALFHRYSVLIFPGQDLSIDQHLDFARRFGPLETTIHATPKDAQLRVSAEIADVANLASGNTIWVETSRKRMF
jgi:hypothetical protein